MSEKNLKLRKYLLNFDSDIVYTSGVDSIIPQAIPVGEVFEKDESFFVNFFVDFNQLKYVNINK